MPDVVDSDELLRRIRRARAYALQELRTCRSRGDAGLSEARMRQFAYEAVVRTLDEILTPGRHGPETAPPEGDP